MNKKILISLLFILYISSIYAYSYDDCSIYGTCKEEVGSIIYNNYTNITLSQWGNITGDITNQTDLINYFVI